MWSCFQTSIRKISPHSAEGDAGGSGTAGPGAAGVSGSRGGAGPPPQASSHTLTAIAMAAILALGAAARGQERPIAEIPPVAPADPYQRLHPPIGEPRFDVIAEGDTLLDVAYRNRVGFFALKDLNPGVDVWIPPVGTRLALPTRLLLPDVELSGLVINIPEMRLFDATAPGGLKVLSAAVGDPEDPTPEGAFSVQGKRSNPAWNVPSSIREERPALPEQVAAGPDNPLGSRWMRIGRTSYGIHGTNNRWSIGRLATHGCVRLYEEDIQELFDRTPEGTPLRLVYQPYKWGRDGRTLLFEAHPDLYGRIPDRLAAALALPRELGILSSVDLEAVWRALDEARGVPVRAGDLPPERPGEVPRTAPERCPRPRRRGAPEPRRRGAPNRAGEVPRKEGP